ncbi:twin-arginine translocase subunit TatB, partial [Paracoccus versutus]
SDAPAAPPADLPPAPGVAAPPVAAEDALDTAEGRRRLHAVRRSDRA